MTITREEILDLLPIYALGTLGPEETAAIDEFLSEHHDLLESIYAATDSVELLALAAPSVRPPAYVKRELMRRIATGADVLPLQARSAPVSPVVRTPKEQEGWRWPTIVRNVLAVSAATTLIALASYSALLSQQVTTMTAQTLEQRERIASLETETSALAGAIDKLKTTIDALEVERTDLVAKNRQLASTNAQLDVRIQEINQELTTDQDRLRLVSAASDAVMLFGGVTAPQSRRVLSQRIVRPAGRTWAETITRKPDLSTLVGHRRWHPIADCARRCRGRCRADMGSLQCSTADRALFSRWAQYRTGLRGSTTHRADDFGRRPDRIESFSHRE